MRDVGQQKAATQTQTVVRHVPSTKLTASAKEYGKRCSYFMGNNVLRNPKELH